MVKTYYSVLSTVPFHQASPCEMGQRSLYIIAFCRIQYLYTIHIEVMYTDGSSSINEHQDKTLIIVHVLTDNHVHEPEAGRL